jgi:hypothetical protein
MVIALQDSSSVFRHAGQEINPMLGRLFPMSIDFPHLLLTVYQLSLRLRFVSACWDEIGGLP